MKKRLLTILMTIMLIAALPVIYTGMQVNAATSKTQDEAISWANSKVGNTVGSGECVALIVAYYQALGATSPGGNGSEYTWNDLPSGWTRVQGGQPQKGDILVYTGGYNNYGHVAIYESDYSTYHQNYNNVRSVQKVTNVKYNDFKNPYWGYIRPNWKSEQPIGTPTVQKSQYWYDLKDTINVTVSAKNATHYYCSVVKDNKKIYEGNVDSGILSFAANNYGIGEYSVYFSCYNSKYSVDSSWVTFNVVGPASYTGVSSAKEQYLINEEVTLRVATVCAKGQVVGIDRKNTDGSWTRVVTKDVPYEYKFKASSLGQGTYAAYFSVYNGSGGVDTERVQFVILESYPDPIHYHTLKHVEAKAATTTSEGNIEYWTCSGCGKYFKDSEGKTEITNAQTVIPKLTHKHSLRRTPAKAATENQDGNTEYWTCSDCGKYFSDSEGKTEITKAQTVIPKLTHKHSLTKTSAKAATTTSEGNIEYWTCSSCGKLFKDSEGKNEITKADTVIPKKSDGGGKDDPSVQPTPSEPSTPTDPTIDFGDNNELPVITISKPKAAKKSMTVRWKAVNAANKNTISGIQIQYSADKKFKKGVKTFKASKNSTSKKFKKLKSKKKYYVRIRSYKDTGKAIFFSDWSKTKAVKVK